MTTKQLLAQIAQVKPGNVITVRDRAGKSWSDFTVTSLPYDGGTFVAAKDATGRTWGIYFRDITAVR